MSERAAAGGGRATPLFSSSAMMQVRPNGYGNTTTWGGPGGQWFGPSAPLRPSAPPDVAGRRWDYPVGYNLVTQPRSYEPIGFAALRAAADAYDVLRTVIETRKDQIESLPWNIQTKEINGKRPKMTPEVEARVKKIEGFLAKPDKERPWRRWLRMLLEELFVIDAPALYRRRTRGGDLYALQIISGDTIKLVVDASGNRPAPPEPAYQQVLHGLPAVDYTADQLIYAPRNQRANKVYGYSPVEQIVTTINIALRRQAWQIDFFTEGNMPEALLGVPETWTPQQIGEFQTWFDSVLAGNTAARRRARFVPGEVAKGYVNLKETELFGAAEEWLARVICFAFSISPQQFIKMMNRATAETSKDQAQEEGLEPIKFWVKDLIDEILVTDFESPDLEFVWIPRVDVDPVKQAEIGRMDAESGVISIDELREDRGRDPVGGSAATLMVKTSTGYVPVDLDESIAHDKAKADAMPKPIVAPPGQGVGGDKNPGDKRPRNQAGDGAAGKASTPASVGEVGSGSVEAPGAGGQAPNGDPDPLPAATKAAQDPTSMDRPIVRRTIKAVQRSVAAVLRDTGDDVAAQVAAGLKARLPAAKADSSNNDDAITPILATLTDEQLDELIASLDLSSLDAIVDMIVDDLEELTADTARAALARIGVKAEEKLVDVVNGRAVAWARERAAELVGKRWNDAGELIDNPNPKFAIDETTRSMIRDAVADGLADNLGIPGIADSIQEAAAFSPERASLVANTEVRRANSHGALEGYKVGKEAGVQVKKSWLTKKSSDVCSEICGTNAAAGAIDLDQNFPSGDAAPPGHPRCRCTILSVVEDDDQEDET